MFMWLSEAYRKRYPARADALRAHVDGIFTNDLLFDLCLGLTNIASSAVQHKYDISQAGYAVTFDNAVITGPRKVSEDPFLNAQRNACLDAEKRFALHRANTVFKANQGLRLGISGLEVELLFMEHKGQTRLWLGHERESMTGLAFQDYLERLARKPDFLWLDIKNVTSDNKDRIRKELAELDSRFSLKDISLVESGNVRELDGFAGDGWRVSFYLPWQAIRDAVKNENDDIVRQVAEQVQQYNIPAVSFDLAGEKEIREKLVPLLPQKTLLYAWTMKRSWADQDLRGHIQQADQYEKILVPLKTAYDY